MIKIFCDLCGKEITGDVHKVAFGYRAGSDYTRNPEMEDIQEEMDFCPECINKVAETIRMLVRPQKIDEPEKPKPVKVDRAKVWALYDAGRDVKWIAHEFYCSKQTIYNILNGERPNMERAFDGKS